MDGLQYPRRVCDGDNKDFQKYHGHLTIDITALCESLFELMQTQTCDPFESEVSQIDVLGLFAIEYVNSLEYEQYIANGPTQ